MLPPVSLPCNTVARRRKESVVPKAGRAPSTAWARSQATTSPSPSPASLRVCGTNLAQGCLPLLKRLQAGTNTKLFNVVVHVSSCNAHSVK
jgi:hypothetical protein